MKLKNNKAITLIALIITIVIIMILTAIVVTNVLNNGGIINATKVAKRDNAKAYYDEQTKFEIADEQIERASTKKDEAFLTSLEKRFLKKDWVSYALKCDENLEENANDYDNNTLIIETKDGMEIYLDVDNGDNKATITEIKFTKDGNQARVIYDPNKGSGARKIATVKKDFSVTLENSIFTRADYDFVGWSKYTNGRNESNQEEIYYEGDKVKITENTTLYAIWIPKIGKNLKIKYKGYDFIVYNVQGDGKCIAKPQTDCGNFSDYLEDGLRAQNVEAEIAKFAMGSDIAATLFSYWEERNLITWVNGNYTVWMYYTGYNATYGVYAISNSGNGYSNSYNQITGKLYPKLTINPSVIVVTPGQDYATIQQNNS